MRKLWTIAVSSFFLFPLVSFGAYEISDGSVKILYHCNNDVVDASGNGHNGTASNISYVTSTLSSACSFNGTNSTITNSDTIGISGDDSRTAILVIKTPSAQTANKQSSPIHLGIEQGGSTYDGWAQQLSSYSGLFARIQSGGGTGNCGGTTNLTPDTWYMITAIYDGTYNKIFVNGIEECSATLGGNNLVTTDGLLSMGDPYYPPDGDRISYQGQIDEFVLIKGVVSTSTLLEIYNSGNFNSICVTAGCAQVAVSSTEYYTQFMSTTTDAIIGNIGNALYLILWATFFCVVFYTVFKITKR